MKKYYQKPVVQTETIQPISMLEASIKIIDGGDSGIGYGGGGDEPARSRGLNWTDDVWSYYLWDKEPWSDEEKLKPVEVKKYK